ncbi:MAG: ABC transporter permease [Anaerolineae bacterium]
MRWRFSGETWGRIGLVGLVWLAFATTDENYRTFGNLFAVMEGFALTGLVALGVGVTMLAGELDLSVASVAALAGIVAVTLVEKIGLIPAMLITGLIFAGFGALQGYLIARTRINSLVFTIGMLIALRGLTHWVSGSQAVIMSFESFDISDALATRLGIFSPFSLLTLTAMALVGFILAYTRLGRGIYASGGNRQAARAAGVNVERSLVAAFVLSSICAAIGGGLASIKTGSASPIAFDGLLLSAVTAALVGGISLYGGRGNVFGIALGTLILRLLAAGFSSRGAPTYIENVATGILLTLVLCLEYLVEGGALSRWRERRHAHPIGRAADRSPLR